MNSLVDKICTLAALVMMLVSLFFCSFCANRAKIAEARLNAIESQVLRELEETEKKCQRYCDTCIDILKNNRWE